MTSAFDYTGAIRRVCEDMCLRLPAFQHIDMTRVCVAFTRSHSSRRYGIWAFLTPLRFKGGEKSERRNGVLYTLDDLLDSNKQPYLYVLTVSIPRFQDLTLTEKYQTIIHELYHISEKFDGDIRRFPGRCFAHGANGIYDKIVRQLARDWVDKDPPPELWNFLTLDFNGLLAECGKVTGVRVKVPRPRRDLKS